MESSVTQQSSVVNSLQGEKIYRASRTISRQAQWRLFTAALVANDAFFMGLGFRIAFWLRFELNIELPFQTVTPEIQQYARLIMVITPLWLLIYALAGLYQRKNLLGGTREYAILFNATTAGMFGVIAVGFLDPTFVVARGWLILAWALVFFLAAWGRFFLRRVVYYLRRHGYFLSPAILVGANDEGLSLARQLQDWKTSGLLILGFVDEKFPAGTPLINGLSVMGRVDQLDGLVAQYQVEELILASSAISSRDKMLEIFKRFGVGSGVNVRMSSGLYEIITTGLSVMEFAYVPLVGVNQVRLTGIDHALKLALDYLITLPGLVLVSPLMLAIALAIKLDSPGPIIHRRRVMGVNGRQFDAYKFRTMKIDGDEILAQNPALKAELERSHKLKNDPRITRIGKYLRKFSLDELPQLFNVVKREMSLVGPRMISPAEIEMYDHWDINLLTVQPGITGLWQVSGRSDVSYEQRVRLDMHYIRNWSFWLDLQLLFQTIPAVFRSRGAY